MGILERYLNLSLNKAISNLLICIGLCSYFGNLNGGVVDAYAIVSVLGDWIYLFTDRFLLKLWVWYYVPLNSALSIQWLYYKSFFYGIEP